MFLLLVSCAPVQPRFEWDFFPIGYKVDHLTSLKWREGIAYRKIELLINEEQTGRLDQFWNSAAYHTLWGQIHPVLLHSREDIEQVLFFLKNKLQIFFIEVTGDSRRPAGIVLPNSLRSIIDCEPLTNNELVFMLNFGNNEQFSKKNLHILLISIHELLHQRGAQPVAPSVVSFELRKKLSLPKLNDPEEINWFSTKNPAFQGERVSLPKGGLVFCQKHVLTN